MLYEEYYYSKGTGCMSDKQRCKEDVDNNKQYKRK